MGSVCRHLWLSLLGRSSQHVGTEARATCRMVWACLYPHMWGGGDNHPGHGCCLLSHFSHAQLFVDAMDHSPTGSSVLGFSRQEHWSGWPCPPPGDLPDPGTELESLTSPALTGRFLPTGATGEVSAPDAHRACSFSSSDQGAVKTRRLTVWDMPGTWDIYTMSYI